MENSMQNSMPDDFNNADLVCYLEKLKAKNFDKYMLLSYNAIVSNIEAAIEDKNPSDKKIQALDNLINYFEKFEEYEKCGVLKQLRTKILEKDGKISNTLRILKRD